ncbi:MAG: hypothetical protein C7B43_07850 [Sulfobacillus benefaciens]|uniref:Transposase putative helix-turn-helix domain-containing protein n=1 Tax=Sulfobacillus benefaciens TaxID=453960 RepID=A0A2T2X5C7_9FIRM|nr:MAG: hypothetical protein C7B43_07850 [Sulfobacillus benefaciens]
MLAYLQQHASGWIPTPAQILFFKQAAGTTRFVWSWTLAERNRQYEAGQKPQAVTR